MSTRTGVRDVTPPSESHRELYAEMKEHYGDEFESLLREALEVGDKKQARKKGPNIVHGPDLTVAAITPLYWRMVREMGPPTGMVVHSRIPSPAGAWLEVIRQKKTPASATFSHPKITEALEAVGGYKALQERAWASSKRDFEMTFRQLTKPNDW